MFWRKNCRKKNVKQDGFPLCTGYLDFTKIHTVTAERKIMLFLVIFTHFESNSQPLVVATLGTLVKKNSSFVCQLRKQQLSSASERLLHLFISLIYGKMSQSRSTMHISWNPFHHVDQFMHSRKECRFWTILTRTSFYE